MLKFGTPGARFYLTISFAGVVRYFHSLAGCDVKAFDQRIPVESDQGRMNRRMVKRRRGRTTILYISQEDSSKSEDWKVCMNLRSSLSGEYGVVGNAR